tara:strand:- start:206 stop:808 length:603 start_codon:yes stop_codon:yes gene_type:complete
VASKRKRKLEMKAAHEANAKMTARREAFSDNLWKFGLPIAVVLLLIFLAVLVIYEPGPGRAEAWELEEAETGTVYKSSDYFNNGKLTFIEFFHTECGHCQQQTEPLKEIYSNYSGEIDMFSIGGYKLGSNKVDSKNDIQQFKFQYTLNWPHLYDTNGELMRDYGFNSYPSMVLIKNGEIVYEHSGQVSYDELSKEIEKHK